MKGALYIIIAIVLLIIGILVIKNMQQTETVTGIQEKEIVEHTEQVVDDVEKKMDNLQKKINKTE